jgi:radical SAM superfamily enzyme YgiQ (UPF0313 family)
MKMANKDLVLFETEGDVTGSSALIRQCDVAPMSLKYLEVYCNLNGNSSTILIQGRKTINELTKEILKYSPKVAAATASTCEFPLAAKVMNGLKKANKNIVTVLGGYHPSSFPQSINPEFCSPDTNPRGIDMLVLGEGERTLEEIMKAVKSDNLEQVKKNIKGIAYMENEQLKITSPRELINDIDALPRVKWTKEELSNNVFDGLIARKDPKNKNVAVVISERGCPYACGFCSTQNVYGRTVRTRSIKNLVDEIEFLIKKNDVDLVVDYAPTGNRDPGRIHELSEEIQRRNLSKESSLYQLWRLESPNGKLMITEDLLKALSESFFGFKSGIGIEALTEEDEIYISKRHSLDNVNQASESFDKYGAIFRGFFMITPKTNKEAIESCRESKVLSLFDDLRVTYLTPYPGSPLYEEVKGKLITENWREFTCQKPIIQSDCLSSEQYRTAQKDILQGFLLNPYRRKRVKQKLKRFPQFVPGMQRYYEKMSELGFEVLD